MGNFINDTKTDKNKIVIITLSILSVIMIFVVISLSLLIFLPSSKKVKEETSDLRVDWEIYSDQNYFDKNGEVQHLQNKILFYNINWEEHSFYIQNQYSYNEDLVFKNSEGNVVELEPGYKEPQFIKNNNDGGENGQGNFYYLIPEFFNTNFDKLFVYLDEEDENPLFLLDNFWIEVNFDNHIIIFISQ